MAGDHKTITLQELPPLNELKDSDILITSDGSTTYKVNGYDFIQYIRKHSDISGFFVHQDTVGRPEGIAPLDAASKLFSNNIPFGSSAGSVFDGASGKALSDALTSHTADKGNPHRVTKAQIGLGNANDTSDLDKPVSTAQQAAIRKACEDAGKYTDTAMSRVVDGAPKDMDTLHKAAKALEEQKKTADALSSLIGNKVDKAAGKKLSTNDYTNEEKAKLLSIENGANHYVHPDTDGCKHIPANGTANDGSYLKSTSKPGIYAWGKLTKEDVTAALGYTPSGSGGVTYALSKSGSNIILTGSDGSETSIPDADTTYTLSDFGIASSPAEINQLKGVKSNVQTQLNNVYTKNEANTLLNDKLAKAGDGSNLTTAFTEAPTLATINTGEKLSVIMGKVKKAIASLISHTGTVATASVSGHVKVDSALSGTSINPVQNKAINTALAGKLSVSGNSGNTTVAYTEVATLTELTSGEKLSAAFGKLKLAVKKVISFARLLGTTDISAVGGGTVTGALAALNNNLTNKTTGFKQLLTADEINDPTIIVSYTGNADPIVCSSVGLPFEWYAIVHLAHAGADGYCHQIAYPITNGSCPFFRKCKAGIWTAWSEWQFSKLEQKLDKIGTDQLIVNRNIEIKAQMYSQAPIVATGDLPAIGFHNPGREGAALYLQNGRLVLLNQSGDAYTLDMTYLNHVSS